MKIYALFLLLCIVAVHGEKRINLEDIERDNLKAENRPKYERIQTDESNYSKEDVKDERLPIRVGIRYGIMNGEPSTYVTPPLQNAIPEEYDYRAQNVLQSQEKNLPTQLFEHSQSFYRPEVTTSKDIQALQQQTLADNGIPKRKESFYVSIPMNQLLSYYPNLDLLSFGSGTKSQPVLHELTSQGSHQISIPFYAPLVDQKQLLAPLKNSYQFIPQFLTAQHLPFPQTSTKNAIYTAPLSSKKQVTSSPLTSPVYVQPDRSNAQEKKLLYTQAIIGEPRQVQRLTFNEPSFIYVQENNQRLKENQLYVQSSVPQQTSNQIFRQQDNHFAKAPEEPKKQFVPPQADAQNFRGDINVFREIPADEEEPSDAQSQYLVNSEPRSLLDTYIPSNFIVARDSARYQEKPLKLESGFFPSKGNFVYQKKRKTQ